MGPAMMFDPNHPYQLNFTYGRRRPPSAGRNALVMVSNALSACGAQK